MHSKKWKNLLDMLMIRTDVAFTLKRSSTVIGCYLSNNVAEALEASGRFAEAAAIYQDCVNMYPSEGNVDLTIFRQANCAVAWRRAGNYDLAEEAYVRALRMQSHATPPLDLSHEGTCMTISNLMCMYYEWSRMNGGEDEHAVNTRLGETRFVDALLLALLHTADFHPKASFADSILSQGGPAHAKFLAPRLRTRRAAKLFLLAAFKAKSASDFRSSIISARDPKIKHISFTDINYMERDIKRDKESARHIARQRHFAPRVCDSVGCENQEGDILFKKCPCKQVCYCSKSCQTSHWSSHKKECAYRAERKKSKK